MNAPLPAAPARSRFPPKDPAFEARVRASFARQKAMVLIGARLTAVAPGFVEIALGYRPELTQQKAYVHGGILGMIADSACGYAGFTLMPEDAAVLTIEFKINLLAPAKGERFRMEGRVIKPGRTITVCEGRAFAIDGSQEKLVATMGCTLMAVTGRDAIQG